MAETVTYYAALVDDPKSNAVIEHHIGGVFEACRRECHERLRFNPFMQLNTEGEITLCLRMNSKVVEVREDGTMHWISDVLTRRRRSSSDS